MEVGQPFVRQLQQLNRLIQEVEETGVRLGLLHDPEEDLRQEQGQYILYRMRREFVDGEAALGFAHPVQVAVMLMVHLHLQHRKGHEQCPGKVALLTPGAGHQVCYAAKRFRVHIYNGVLVVVGDGMKHDSPGLVKHTFSLFVHKDIKTVNQNPSKTVIIAID